MFALSNGTHEVLAAVLVTLIAIHVLAALDHAASDGVERRMGFARTCAA